MIRRRGFLKTLSYGSIAYSVARPLGLVIANVASPGIRIYPYGLKADRRRAPIPPGDADILRIVAQDDDMAKNEILSSPDTTIRKREASIFRTIAPELKDWRPAKCLLVMRQQVNQLNLLRDRHDDGMVGDARHAARNSDHNPWVDVHNGIGVVTAYDITHNPKIGCDCNKITESLVASRDSRIKYVIWNRFIYNSDPIQGSVAWAKRDYHGEDPHTGHIHISVLPTRELYDSEALWKIAVG
jgi:hypothetical protein